MIRTLALLASLLAGTGAAGAAEVVLDLGGCENKVFYDPAVFTAGAAALAAYDRAFPNEPAEDKKELAEDLAGIFKDPRTGKSWFLIRSAGMSCDPSYLLKPADPKEPAAEFFGEVIHVSAAARWKLLAKFNLYFEIERTIDWTSGRPVEVVPYFYPVRRKTKALVELPLFPDIKAAVPTAAISPGVAVSVLGYGWRERRALVRSADGKTGWIVVDDKGLLEGVYFYGD